MTIIKPKNSSYARLFTALLAYLFISSSAYAQQWYHIELIVFEQLDTVTDEQSPVGSVPGASFSPLTQNELIHPAKPQTLLDTARSLKQSGRYQVHYHEAWQQPILTKASAKSIKVDSDMVSGRLRLHKGTYLYATVDLQLNRVMQNNDWSEVGGVRKPYLKEARRIRSKKLHFFDHPHLGALLKLTPIDKAL